MKLVAGAAHIRRTVRHGGSLPCRFDPVEQRQRREPMEPHERVREAIYAWMDEEAGTDAERSAWEHFRRACKAWLANSRHDP